MRASDLDPVEVDDLRVSFGSVVAVAGVSFAVMVAYSARLAIGATLTGLVFSVFGRLFPWWWSVLLALVLLATSVASLWWTGRLRQRPVVRSHVVETVASV